MADKKLFDMGIGIMFGVLVFSLLIYVISAMDIYVNNNSITNKLQPLYDNISSSDSTAFAQLDTSVYGANGSNFNLNVNQQIDTRMQGQGMNKASSDKGVIKTFLNNVSIFNWDIIGILTKFMIILFGFITIILATRMMIGSSRI